MTENCLPITIPEVDNSSIPCEEYYNALCVIYEKTAPYIGITTDDKSVTEVINAIVAKLITQSTLINNLNIEISEIEGLPNYIGYTPVTVDYTILATDYTIDGTVAGITITLLDIASVVNKIFNITNSSGGNITVNTTSLQNIYMPAGTVTSVVLTDGESLTVQSTPTYWRSI